MEFPVAHNNAAVADNPQCSVKSCDACWAHIVRQEIASGFYWLVI